MSETVEQRIARVLPALDPAHIPATAAALEKALPGIGAFGELIPSDSEQFLTALSKSVPPEARPAPPPIPTNAEKLRAEAQAQVRSKFTDQDWFHMLVSEKERLIQAMEHQLAELPLAEDELRSIQAELSHKGLLAPDGLDVVPVDLSKAERNNDPNSAQFGQITKLDEKTAHALGERALNRLKLANALLATGKAKPTDNSFQSLSAQMIRLKAGEKVLLRAKDGAGLATNAKYQQHVYMQLMARDRNKTQAFMAELNK